VQTQPGVVLALGRLQPAQDVDLLVDLATLGQAVERLDHPGLDAGEAVQLEGLPQRLDHTCLDQALGGQQFGEPAQRGRSGHGLRVPG
jgi:hypothetical protein